MFVNNKNILNLDLVALLFVFVFKTTFIWQPGGSSTAPSAFLVLETQNRSDQSQREGRSRKPGYHDDRVATVPC